MTIGFALVWIWFRSAAVNQNWEQRICMEFVTWAKLRILFHFFSPNFNTKLGLVGCNCCNLFGQFWVDFWNTLANNCHFLSVKRHMLPKKQKKQAGGKKLRSDEVMIIPFTMLELGGAGSKVRIHYSIWNSPKLIWSSPISMAPKKC